MAIAHRNLLGCVLISLLTLSFGQNQEPARGATGTTASNNETTRTVIVNGVAEPVYHRGRGITFPQQIYSPDPEFSDEARKRRVEGVVTLSAIVTSKGETTDVRVLEGRGYGLDEKAVEAVRRWKFRPGSKDGKPVAVELNVEVSFRFYHRP